MKKFHVFKPNLAMIEEIKASNIDTALDAWYPEAYDLDCISDHITVFRLPSKPGFYQIVEEGWKPTTID